MVPEAGGGLSAFQDISTAVHDLTSASNSGFTISTEGGQALLSAIDTLHGKVSQHLQKGHFLAQQLPLGSSPAANTFKPFLATVASDPAQGAIAVLQQLKRDLEDAHEAIQKNMASYQLTEQRNTATVRTPGN